MKKECKYTRKGKQIRNTETGLTTGYQFINEAKRESHRLQMEHDMALGLGTVRLA